MDYSADFLEARTPLSFHKHWMCDPRAVYADLIKKPEETDIQTDKDSSSTERTVEEHEEL